MALIFLCSVNSGTSHKMSQYKPLHTIICAPASYKTVVSYKAMGIKRVIQLTVRKVIDKKMESSYQSAHNVLIDEEMGGCRVKAKHFDRN